MSATEAVFHYKKKLTRHSEDPDPEVVLHCLAKLDRVPMTTGILQETGVGRVVNGLKKSAQPGSRVSNLARAIVQKWKDIVATEEDREQQQEHEHEHEQEQEHEQNQDDHDEENLQGRNRTWSTTNKETGQSPRDDQGEDQDQGQNRGDDSRTKLTSASSSSSSSGCDRNDRHSISISISSSSISNSSSSSKHHRKDKKDKGHHKKSDPHTQKKDSSRSSDKRPSNGQMADGGQLKKAKEKEKKVSQYGTASKEHTSHHRGQNGHDPKKQLNSKDKPPPAAGGGEFEEAMLGVDQRLGGKKRQRHHEPTSSSSSSSSSTTGSGNPKVSNGKKGAPSPPAPSAPPAPPAVENGFCRLPSDITPHYKSRQDIKAAATSLNSKWPSSAVSMNSLSNRQNDEEALSALISMSKKSSNRHVIYSGVRRSAFTEVPRLFDICIHTLQEHVDKIDECGNLPFDIMEPVLERATPQVLMNIERHNLYLVEDTGPLWERHCKKEFPKEEREEFESWREMYERCWQTREEKLDSLKAKMGASYENARNSVRHTKLYAGSSTPRHVRRAQEKNGTGSGSGSGWGGLTSTSSSAGVKRQAGTSAAQAVRPMADGGPARPVVVPPDKSKKPKIAPMMAKTLKMARGLKFKR